MSDVTNELVSDVIKNELKDAGRDLVYTAMQKTVAPERQSQMEEELKKSEAVGMLIKRYLDPMQNLPGPLQLALLLGQKYGKVLLT